MHERCFATAVDFSSAWLEEMEVMQWRCSVDSPPSPFQTPQYSTSDSFFGWRNVAPLIRDSCRASQVWLNPNNFSETREQKYAGLELWSIFKEILVHACRIWELNLWGDNKKHHQPEWVLCSLLGIPVTICKLSTKGLIRLGFVRPQWTGVQGLNRLWLTHHGIHCKASKHFVNPDLLLVLKVWHGTDNLWFFGRSNPSSFNGHTLLLSMRWTFSKTFIDVNYICFPNLSEWFLQVKKECKLFSKHHFKNQAWFWLACGQAQQKLAGPFLHSKRALASVLSLTTWPKVLLISKGLTSKQSRCSETFPTFDSFYVQ